MDGFRIEAIRKALDEMQTPRRSLMKAAVGGMIGASGAHSAVGQEATPETSDQAGDPQFLFVQSFLNGELTPVSSNAASPTSVEPYPGATPITVPPPDFVLTLSQGLGQTLYFSDRPDRIVGTVPTADFLEGLGFSPVNPPNAALVADVGNGDEEILVVELTNPRYDEATSTATYDVRLLEGFERIDMAFETDVAADRNDAVSYGASHLFIDDCPDGAFTCTTPNAWIGCASPGTLNEGQCWQGFPSFTCGPCRDYRSICNQLYPDFCKGNCIVKTQEEVRRQCLGG